MNFHIIQLAGIIYCGILISAAVNCPLDPLCGHADVKDGFVWEFCAEHNGSMLERCCLSNKNGSSLLGLDMRDCNLTEVNITNIPRGDVKIIDLHHNFIKYVDAKEFVGFVKLEFLYLPLKTECPGGDVAWNHTFANADDNFTECVGQLSTCDYLNVSCTINGQCIQEGPGSAKCVCIPNHFGYKCLQEGVFPTTKFYIGIFVPCIVLSIVLWFYLRKDVIPLQKQE